MATENSEMEVDGIENDSKYKYSFVLGFSSKRMNFHFFNITFRRNFHVAVSIL